MPALKNLIEKSATVAIEFMDETLTVTYNPAMLTTRFYRTIEVMQKGKDNEKTVIDMVKLLVQKWDLTDDDGKMVPVTTEVLQQLPMTVLNDIILKITQGLKAPNESATIG